MFSATIAIDHVRRGQARQAAGDLGGALSDFEQALAAAPDCPEALNARGIVHYLGGRTDAARADFDRALAALPDCAEAYNNRGLVRRAQGDVAGALADFAEALLINPEYGDALGNRGLAYHAAGRPAEARADLDRAVTLASGAAQALCYHNRALVRREIGDLHGAREDLDRALHLDPGPAHSYAARAEVRQLLGDLEGALTDWDRALERTPSAEAAAHYHGRAAVQVARLDFSAALADCDAAIRLRPDFAIAYISRAHARYHLRDGRAVFDYVRALEIAPAVAAREVLRIAAEHATKDWELVLSNCDKHLRSDPDDAIAAVRRGLTLLLLGRRRPAAEDFGRACARFPRFRKHLQLVLEAAGLSPEECDLLTVSSDPCTSLLARSQDPDEFWALAARGLPSIG
jgi:tetratricopeptide (TPR) repeat protein